MAAATVTTHIAAGGKNISNGNSVCMTQAQAMETDVVALEVRLVGVRTTATTSAMLTSQTRDPITTEVETISTPSPPPVVDAVCCNKEQLLKKANENDIVPEIVSTEVALLAATIFIDSSTQTESDSETERGLTVIIEEETDFEIAETVESKKQENDEDFSINDSEIGLTCNAIIDANDRISEQSEVANLEVNINIDKHEKKEEDSDDEDDDDDDIEDDDGGEEECYTYKERIIDFDNLRIIEHVIDNHCKVKRKHNKKGKLQDNLVDSDSKSKLIDCAIAIENSEKEETVECGGSKMHNSGNTTSENVFACRELVAFIDESYSVIDNARAYESNRENGIDIETFDMKKSKTGCVQTGVKQNFNSNDDNNEKDHYNYNHNVEIVDNDANIDVQDGLEFTSSLQIVDDNNNMRDNNTNSNAENDGSTNGNAVFGLVNQNSRNCDRTACPNDVNSTEKVFQMTLDRENVTKVQKNLEFELDCEHQTVPIGVGATLKAFKSKLTPSAPPFEPAASRIKLNATATSAAATAGLYAAYEQTTTIYYKQQNQIQQNQQQQQQQQLQQTKLNQAQQLVKQSSMLHAYSLSQKKKLIPTQQTHHYQHQQHQPHQPHQPHQHQQHMLIAQAAHQQQQQQKQHASKQQHQKHHQQQLTAREYCAQHNSNVAAITTHTGAGTIPHLHVHAPGTAAAISTANNTAAHATHLLPLQLISLTTQQTTGVPTGIWPLVEAPFYIDTNGEFRTYCPAHGPPVPVPAPAPPANTSAPLLSITPANSSTTNITAVQPHSLPTLLVTQHQHQKHQNHQQTQQIGQHQQQNQQQFQHHQQIQNQQQIYTSSPTATTEATRQLFLQLDNGVHNNSIPMPLLQQYQQPQQQQHQQQHIRAGKRGKVNRGK